MFETSKFDSQWSSDHPRQPPEARLPRILTLAQLAAELEAALEQMEQRHRKFQTARSQRRGIGR